MIASKQFELILNLKDNVSADLSRIGQEAGGLEDKFDRAGNSAGRTGGAFSNLGSTAGAVAAGLAGLAVAAGAVAVGFGVQSVQAAAGFEASINNLAAVAGTALTAAGISFDELSAKALELGSNTRYSASESLDAMTELVKGGVAVTDVMGDATQATLDLAAASGIDLGNAAEYVAKQLGVWADTGVSATDVANLLSSAANASTIGVDDLALGLANAGGQAKVMGVSFEDLTQTLSLIAPNFSSASDAGTSYKTFLASLIPTTASAQREMEALGLYTEETGSVFFDANGNFVGMEETARLLFDATSNLTDEQKALALSTIFGTDALRAAAAIAAAGAEGFNAQGEAMRAAGTAAEVAAIQNQGFAYAQAQLAAAMEGLQITVGMLLLPSLTEFVQFLAAGVGRVTTFVQSLASGGIAFDGVTTAVQAFLAPLQPLIAQVLPALASLWDTIAAAFASSMPAVQSQGDVWSTLAQGLTLFAQVVLVGLVQSFLLLIKMLQVVLPPVIRITIAVIEMLMATFSALGDLVGAVVGVITSLLAGDFESAWASAGDVVAAILKGMLAVLTGFVRSIAALFGDAGRAMVDNLLAGFTSAWAGAWATIQGKIGELRNLLPGSEPKDKSSPLYRLGEAGQAIVGNLQSGMNAAPSLQLPPAPQASALVPAAGLPRAGGSSAAQPVGGGILRVEVALTGAVLREAEVRRIADEINARIGREARLRGR